MGVKKVYANFGNIKAGQVEFEGLKVKDVDEYFISIQQVARLFKIGVDDETTFSKTAQNTIKALIKALVLTRGLKVDSLGKLIENLQEPIENQGKSTRTYSPKFTKLWVIRPNGHSDFDNCLNLSQMNLLMMSITSCMHKKIKLTDETINFVTGFQNGLVGTALNTLFDDAFDVAYDKERTQMKLVEYQLEWGRIRANTADGAVQIDNYLKWKFEDAGEEKIALYRMSCHQAIDMGLFGKKPATIRAELELKGLIEDSYADGIFIRNFMSTKALDALEKIQEFAIYKMEISGMKPVDACQMALNVYDFPVMDYLDYQYRDND